MKRRTAGYVLMVAALGLAAAARVPASIAGDGADLEIKPAQIRCWQDGELIFAEDGWNPAEQMDGARVITLNARKPGQGKLLVMDLQRATCVLKQQ